MMNVIVSWPRLRLYLSAATRQARQAGDIEAVDHGEVVTAVCSYHGDYGRYPHWRYMPCQLELAPGRPVIRPTAYLSYLWRRIPIEEQVISAQVRPFRSQWEAFRRGGADEYAEGGMYQHRSVVIVACETTGGTLEFNIRCPDVGLVLHYLNKLASAAPPGPAPAGNNL